MAVLHDTHVPVMQSEMPWALRHGAVGGIVAGIVFAIFEMVASAMMMGAEAFFMPLRMIGAILVGPEALQPTYPLTSAGLAGVAVHMVLSVAYGIVFAALAGGVRSGAGTITAASIYGLALWLINFYLIAPLAFPWFQQANPIMQFVGHTFFFGSVLGLWIWWSHERLLRETPTTTP